MKVSELINELSKHDPNSEVIISGDAEGNRHSTITAPALTAGIFVQDTQAKWTGEFYSENWTADDCDMDDDDFEWLQAQPRAVCIWPTN